MSDVGRFKQAMAEHLAELRLGHLRQRSLPIAAQLGVIGVAGGVSMIWLGEQVAMGRAAGAMAAFVGMALFVTAMLINPGRRTQLCPLTASKPSRCGDGGAA